MIDKVTAQKALETLADQARQMIEFMAISSTHPTDKEVALRQIETSKNAMNHLLDIADV